MTRSGLLSCRSSPYNFPAASCSSVCTESGGELICDVAAVCSLPTWAWAVTGYGASSDDVSIWGYCNPGPSTTTFCCTFNESSAITDVILKGTNSSDERLAFVYDKAGANERSLQPWDSDSIDAIIQGKLGGDSIFGSDYGGSDYSETLKGYSGGDTIYGYGGDDTLIGGDGNDVMYGGGGKDKLIGEDGDDELNGDGGNDTLWGGNGDDTLYGDDGSDKLCDASGFSTCATDGVQIFDGGDGDDKAWYAYHASCSTILIDLDNSTMGAGTDYCGDNTYWVYDTSVPANHELPFFCETPITVEPTLCSGQY